MTTLARWQAKSTTYGPIGACRRMLPSSRRSCFQSSRSFHVIRFRKLLARRTGSGERSGRSKFKAEFPRATLTADQLQSNNRTKEEHEVGKTSNGPRASNLRRVGGPLGLTADRLARRGIRAVAADVEDAGAGAERQAHQDEGQNAREHEVRSYLLVQGMMRRPGCLGKALRLCSEKIWER